MRLESVVFLMKPFTSYYNLHNPCLIISSPSSSLSLSIMGLLHVNQHKIFLCDFHGFFCLLLCFVVLLFVSSLSGWYKTSIFVWKLWEQKGKRNGKWKQSKMNSINRNFDIENICWRFVLLCENERKIVKIHGESENS